MRAHDLQVLESIVASRGGFSHREHLELAWSHLSAYDEAEAQRVIKASIRHFASAHGAADKYHETITRFWVRMVALHHGASGADSFDEFLGGNPELLDGRLLTHHYSPELLDSPRARKQWVEPDRLDLPAGVR